jgi:ABC-2 type transport system ATP-binding protein
MRSSWVGAAAAAACLLAAAPAAAEQVTVTSFDGTKLDAEFLPAQGLKPGERAPTIVLTHGFGATRETTEIQADAFETALGQIAAGRFRARGYNTITYDSRGFGRSGGEIDLDSPQVDGRDAAAIVDAVARRPEAQLDAPGDPRVGMHGASYGGGIQWALASRDRRVDALVPAISWTSLVQALGRDGRLKLGWGLPLVGLGEVTGLALGVFAPQGLELGAMPGELLQLAIQGAVTGRSDGALNDYLAARSTGDGIANVRAPALILQGTADTLFTPSQSLEMRRLLRRAGTPAKVIWFCGGHGICRTGNGAEKVMVQRVLAWMDRWLKDDRDAPIGPGFEWTADDGALRSAADFPLREAGEITASGSGRLAVTPLSTLGGLLVAALPAPAGAVEVRVPAQASTKEVVGEPVVRLRYRGTATTPGTHLYAQLVDERRNLVVGNQVTPIPVTLDGKEREVERPLEAVAMHVTPGSRYRLQIIDGSNVYGLTTSAGSVDLRQVSLRLPVGDVAGTPGDPALTGTPATPAAPGRTSPVRTRSGGRTRIGLRAFARSGVLVRGTAPSARRVRVRLRVSAATARRLGLRSRTIATGRTARATSWRLRLKPTVAARRALARRASTTMSVTVSSGTRRPTRVVVRR